MNILAHMYLSGEDEDILIGNFIGDFVKGRQIEKYPEEIAKGIRLHREIDHFTDMHPYVKKVNGFYRSKYGKHAGVVTDIVFDYFLSNNWELYSDKNLDIFIKKTYKTLNRNIKKFPFQVVEFYPLLVLNNWLKLYQSMEGLHRVLKGMSARTSLPGEYEYAIEQVKKNYDEIENLFIEFFDAMVKHVNELFQIDIRFPI